MKKRMALVLSLAFMAVSVGCAGRSDGTSNVNITSNEEPEKGSTVETISVLFEEKGYRTKYEKVEHFILSGDQYILFLDEDKQLSIYRYDTAVDARKDANNLNKDGYSTNVAHIDWVSTPHFFLYDNLILQYIGTDETILTILTDLCGEQFAGGDIANVPAFSYQEDLQIYRENDPGIKCDGFQNTSESEVSIRQQAIDRAKNECTITYDTIDVFYDSTTDMWKVVFSTEGTLGGCQSVYLNNEGLTCLIVYGE